eukprot:GHVO01049306.1.p1 GENE.GHVO01049306.1~~GHVO01049306.1.p1  ORF type:complete len:116 (-),score=28.56 GHVO01049306.1:59-406(-)
MASSLLSIPELQKKQSRLQALMQDQYRLSTQQAENQIVLEELKLLEAEAQVYKLVGPVLVKEDTTEAVGTVQQRLKYIETEIGRIEGLAKEIKGELMEAEKMLAAKQAPGAPVAQ